MFYYHPPKSSIWGHRLRKMPAERAKTRFTRFLETAVGEYKFSSASLTIDDSSGEIVPRFERLTGAVARNCWFDRLTEEQCEKCIDEIIKEEASVTGEASPFVLAQFFEISKWRIDGQNVDTNSRITMYYGKVPCISTLLQFDTIEQFQSIKQVLDNLRLCKLNEKHLKLIKEKK